MYTLISIQIFLIYLVKLYLSSNNRLLLTLLLLLSISVANMSRMKLHEQQNLESLIFGKDILNVNPVSKSSKRTRDEDSLTTGLGGGSVWDDEDDNEIQIDLNSVDRLKKLKTFVESDHEDDEADDHYSDDSDNDNNALRSTRGKASNKTMKVHSDRNPDILFGSELSEKLKSRFETSQHSWTKVNYKTHEESLDALLQSESGMTVKSKSGKNKNKKGSLGQQTDRDLTPLTNTKINIQRCTDVNVASPGASGSTITSIKFHPTRPDLVLVGDSDKYLKMFRITPQVVGSTTANAAGVVENECQFNLKMADLSIHQAEFVPSRFTGSNSNISEIIVTGRKPYFYSYETATGAVVKHSSVHKQIASYEHMCLSPGSSADGAVGGPIKMAVSGSSGYIHILDAHRKTWLTDVKMNTGSRSLCFYDDNTLISSGVDAGVYIWDLRHTGRCLHKFHNEDGTASTSLAVANAPSVSSTRTQYSPSVGDGKKCLAVGSESGVVSLFDIQMLLPMRSETTTTTATATAARAMKPYKSCMNLSTVITSMAMHANNQLLAVASDRSRDQLRLIHTPSGTVYSNWPTDKTPLRRISSLAFSNSSNMNITANNNSNYFAVGNNKGKVLLYQINHQL